MMAVAEHGHWGGAVRMIVYVYLCLLQIHPISLKLIFTRTDTSRFQNPFSQEGT